MPRKHEHLGDGVYVTREHSRLVISLEAIGGVVTDRIALEPETYQALVAYAAKPHKPTRQERKVSVAMKRIEEAAIATAGIE